MPQPFPPAPRPPRRPPSLLGGLRANFFTGLIVILPLILTVWLIWGLVGWVDGMVLPFVPHRFRPEQYIGVNLRGVGLVFFLVFTILVGWVAKGFIGRTLIRAAERLVDRMPVVRSVYSGLKQIAETVFAQRDSSFDRACLVEYPREGIWAIAFVASTAKYEIAARMPGEDEKVAVFLPTTPNPTSGFLLFVRRAEILELEMTVEDAAKLIISAGLVYPNGKDPRRPATPPPAPRPGGVPPVSGRAPALR